MKVNVRATLGALETLDIVTRQTILIADNRRLVIEKIRKALLDVDSSDVRDEIVQKIRLILDDFDAEESESEYVLALNDNRLDEFEL